MGIVYINGKKYLDKQVIEALIAGATGVKGDFQKTLDQMDAKQERRNKIGNAVLQRQAEFFGLPPLQMVERRKKIEDEEAAKIDGKVE